MIKTRVLSIVLLLASAIPSCFATQNFYQANLVLKPESRSLQASVVVRFAAPAAGSSVRFLLNKSLKVTTVKCLQCAGFRFATSEASTYRYMPDGAPLYINLKKQVKAGEELQVTIAYEGALTELAWGVNMLTPEYVELAQYIGWYPFMPEMGKFRYAVNVSIDPAYSITGEGIVTEQARGHWRVLENAETFDMVLAAGRGMRTKTLPGSNLKLVYTTGITDSAAEKVLEQMNETVKSFTSWFGAAASGGHLTLLLNERTQGGSYVRPGFVSLAYTNGEAADTQRRIIATLGHEIGHLWWTGASVTTWEDWLNESFAEYSSWLMLKQVYGSAEFEKQIARSQERTKGKPPIWGIDRNADEAYFVLYDKGALLLNNLAMRLGDKQFLALASRVAQLTPRTTAEFLAMLEKTTSPEIRGDFEGSLKR